jgi:hypothetical protein
MSNFGLLASSTSEHSDVQKKIGSPQRRADSFLMRA